MSLTTFNGFGLGKIQTQNVSSGGAITFSDNFTSYADTTAGDAAYPTGDTSRLRVNPTTDVLDITSSSININKNIYYDIGTANISETAWILRFKLNLTTVTQSSATVGNEAKIFMGMTQLKALGEVPTDDILGMVMLYNPGEFKFVSYINDGGAQTKSTITSVTPSATTYYVQMIRLSATSFQIKLFSDSAYSTQVGATNTQTITSSYSALRYFTVHIFTQDANGSIIGTIDDIKFYNGVTSV